MHTGKKITCVAYVYVLVNGEVYQLFASVDFVSGTKSLSRNS